MQRLLSLLAALLAVLATPAAHAAASWIIVDSETGHILDEGNRNEKRQIASLTKIATAMVVLDWAEATGTSMATPVEVPAATCSPRP
jgi:D-alanyl-D-alanine carboxypeptidase (penicillin-binding protein 5/6)